MEQSVMLNKKVVVMGDSGVGKSSILARLIEGTFMNRDMPTLGADFHKKESALIDKG